jgi:glycosyltransferase involved in cell wall biosynthesis
MGSSLTHSSGIDVVVPCYNYGRYLRQCVDSVLQQEDVAFRVLIIDDCSTDNSDEVGRSLAAQDSRVEFRRHSKNLGHIATYNEGFDWVSDNSTLLLSADDLLTPGALARAARVMTLHPDVGLVYGGQILVQENVPPAEVVGDWTYEIIRGSDLIQRMCESGSNPVTTPTAVVRTSVVRAVGAYNASLPHSADMEYWLRVAVRSSVGVIKTSQAYKRCHSNNMQIEYVRHAMGDLKQRMAAFESFYKQDGWRLQNAAQLLGKSRQTIATQAFWAASEAFDRGADAQCQDLLELAHALDPTLPRQRQWRRMVWKRRMGARAWRTVRPLIDFVRRQCVPA